MSWLEQVFDGAQDILESLDLDCVEDTKNRVREVDGLARETFDFCTDTVAKSTEMISFAMDIKDTLDGFRDGMDASDLKTVKELIEGDKMKAAMGIAGEIDDIALTCINKSIEMTTKMQEGYDVLPSVVREGVDRFAGEDEDPEDMSLDVEPDISELEECINAVKELNLFTAMEAGTRAFNGLTSKADVCMNLFERIKSFAEAVATITEAMMDLDVREVISKVKDMCRCIRLTDVMRAFCEGVRRLITFIIDLFKECSERLSCLWAALDYAKDCLESCGAAAVEAKERCVEAFAHGTELIDICTSVRGQLENLDDMNAGSIAAFKNLADGDEVSRSIDLARGMDDQVVACVEKVVSLIDTVRQGWEGLPSIVTDGIDDLVGSGRSDDDPSPADVEGDISELDICRGEVESAGLLETVQALLKSFTGVSDKVDLCKSMLSSAEGFSDGCSGSIAEFMGTWNLETMGDKIRQICRCAALGEMLRQFAEEVKRLVMSVISLLEALLSKVTNPPLPDLGDMADSVGDAISDGLDKIKFW